MTEQPSDHILVVDDHREIRDALSDYLSRNGFRVSRAADAAEARQLLAHTAVDLAVLDIMMPGEDGLSLYRDLRSSQQLPVIFLTAVADETDRVVGLELGADDYVTKPFNPRELLARIRAVLRRWRALPPAAPGLDSPRVRFERWDYDASQRELIGSDGQQVSLSSGEAALLEVLLARPGVVLSRDQLLDLSRGREARAFDRSVDIQISRLRRKIERDPGEPRIIKTHRGGGYSLAVEVEPV